MERFQIKNPGASVPKRTMACLKNLKGRRFSAFTLVELIVVIAILAILATIGFLALSGYTQDAKDSALKANVRSVQTAISAEAAVTNNSPRYYVVHDSWAALSGAFAYFDNSQTTLSWWAWNQAGTNYSAWNPDYAKLKLNPEKFKAARNSPFETATAYDLRYLVVGAVDVPISGSSNGKARNASYFQVAGISPITWTVVVTGNYPASSGSVAGLVKDPKSASLSWALVDWANSSVPMIPAGCPAVSKTVNGRSYSVPTMANGAAGTVAFNAAVAGWTQTYSQNFACTDGTVTASGAETGGTTVCFGGYSLIIASCVPATCQSIKNAYPSSADGTYSIDPDGIGAGAAFNALCDMTTDGGGWTLVSYAGTISGTPRMTAGVTNGTFAKPLFFDFGTYDASAKTTKTSFSKVRQFRPLFTENTEYLARRTGNANNMLVFPMPASSYSTWFWRTVAEGDFTIPNTAFLPYLKLTNSGNSGWKTVTNNVYWSYDGSYGTPGINWNASGWPWVAFPLAGSSDNADSSGNYATSLNHRSILYWQSYSETGYEADQWFHAQPLSLAPSTGPDNSFQDFEFYVRF